MAEFLDAAIESIGGDPATDACQACGHAWRPPVDVAVSVIRGAHDRYATALETVDPYVARAPLTWSPAAYTWHVADVCRVWAERAVALREEPGRPFAPFDQETLAEARGYDGMAVSAALWALEMSTRSLVSEVGNAGTDLPFTHPDWGEGTLGDALRWVAHEVLHHEVDVRGSAD